MIVAGACFGPALLDARQFAFRDAGHYYYPLYQRVQQEWEAGRLPLWAPEENGGAPLLGNPTAAVLYPGKLIYAAVPYPWAARLYVVAHTALAYAAMVALARSWGISRTGSALAGFSYAFGAPVLFQYCNVIYLVGASWAPLGFRAAARWARLGRRWGLVELALVLAMQALGGDPQAAYLTALCAFGYALGLAYTSAAWRTRPWRRGPLTILAGAGVIAASGIGPARALSLGTGQALLAVAWLCGGALLLAGQARHGGQAGSSPTRVMAGLAAATALALALVAVQYVPVTENVLSSVRMDRSSQAHVYEFSLEPYRVVEWIWPNVFGTVTAGNRYWLPALPPASEHRPWSLSLYIGVLPLVLAFGAAGFRGRPPWQVWILAVVLVCGVASLGKFASPAGWTTAARTAADAMATPHPSAPRDEGVGGPYWLLSATLPGFRLFRYPAKLWTFTSLGLSCLAGVGWDEVASGRTRRPAALAAGLAALTMLVLATVYAARQSLIVALASASGATSDVFGPLDIEGAVADIVRGLVHGGAALVLAAAALHLAPRWPRTIGLAATIGLALDLALANAGLVVTARQAEFDREPRVLEAIRAADQAAPTDGPYRIHRMKAWAPSGWSVTSSPRRLQSLLSWERDTLQPNFGLPAHVCYTVTDESSIEGAAYQRFFQPFPVTVGRGASALLMTRPGQRVLYYPRRGFDLWNTRYFILPANPAGWQVANRGYASFLDQSELIYPGPAALGGAGDSAARERWLMTQDVQVRRNLAAFPRAWVVHEARAIKPIRGPGEKLGAAVMRQLLFQNDPIWSDADRPVVDLRKTAFVETDAPAALAELLPRTPPKTPGQVEITEYGPQRVVLSAALSHPGIVVLADANDPGWTLSIDGAPAPVLRVNRVMRGAAVRAGKHSLVYTYEPQSLRIGAAVSAGGLVLLGVLALWCRRSPLASIAPASRNVA